MKTKDEILAEISDVLAGEFEIPREKLTADARLYEDLDLDSIDAVDLVVRIQQRTGIKVVAEDFKSIRTLGDVAGVIEKLVSEQSK
ncbi:MAG: acyl carrier protein [Kiritimatiellae bacterium]|jgi:acyl carrier protein|nr:acyl carrier protein [Kiritimatiellia bacterium]MBR4476633.1 acyl carrier protein [Kiritimatiellia bacterium]